MPRLLPRLLNLIQQHQLSPKKHAPARSRPPPSPPARPARRATAPAEYSFSAKGRTQSLLLDDPNPIIHPDVYVHKREPSPIVQRVRRGKDGKDERREMTEQEREWWSSPWLRMLASPVRQCNLTLRYFPKDFLIRLAEVRLPPARLTHKAARRELLVPDGVQHPRYKARIQGNGVYFVCWRAGVAQKAPRTRWRAYMWPLLTAQISHLLRLRVLQELELLSARLSSMPSPSSDNPIPTLIRRLTRDEMRVIRDTGRVPHADEGAVALLVVPPLSGDKETGERAEGSMSAEFDAAEHARMAASNPRVHVPLATMVPLTSSAPSSPPSPDDLELDFDESALKTLNEDASAPPPALLPRAEIPLYNSAALFPARPQRAALHRLLVALTAIDRQKRGNAREQHTPVVEDNENDNAIRTEKGKEKEGEAGRRRAKDSHTFMLCADARTVRRADTVPLAIALWRLRMWEGGPWDEQGERRKRWVMDTP